MTDPSPSVTVRVYRRADCHLCDEARVLLQAVLEERAVRGEPAVRVQEIDIATDPDLERRYGTTVPVLAVDDQRIDLVVSARQIRTFLDRVAGRLV